MSTTSPSPGLRIAEHARSLRGMPFGVLLTLALFSNFFVTGMHNRQRVLELGVLLAMTLAVLVLRPAALGGLFGLRAEKPLAAFFLLGIAGSAFAFSPGRALTEVSLLFLLYLFARLVAAEIAQGGRAVMLRLVQLVAIVCALHSLKFWVAYVASFILHIPLDTGDFTMGFSNIRFFNHAQTPILPLVLMLCCVTPATSRLRRLWWSLAAYWWMAIFATSGRGVLMGMVGGCIAVAVLRRRLALPYIKAAALTAGLGLLGYLVFLVVVPVLAGGSAFGAFASVVERTAADPVSNRLVLWGRALDLIVHHPLLGVGPMHFAHNAGDLHTGAHPHDWVMQIASEWGIPAFLCLCVTLACGARALLRAGARLAVDDKPEQAICSTLVAGGAAILVDGLVSGLFVMPQSQLAVVLFIGCAIGWGRTHAVPAQNVTRPDGIRRAAVAGLALAAAVCLVIVAGPDAGARYRDEPLTPAQEALNTGVNWPRLWHAGFF
jgi:putative inorganic carbon (HCO3(-)) transporter